MVEKICKTCGSPFYPAINGGSEECDYCLTHCEHGTYIGFPGGPDYLCYWCEAGISAEKMEKMLKARQVLENRWIKHRIRQLIKILKEDGVIKSISNRKFLNTIANIAKDDVKRYGKRALTIEWI